MPTALITGASRGLGLALARDLAQSGWDLVIDGRDRDRLEAAAASIRALSPTGATVTAVPGDVTHASHQKQLELLLEDGLDLLVNNASRLGPSPQPPLDSYPLHELRRVYETNVVAPIALVQALLPALRSRGGVVLNITSDAAVEPYPGWGGYGSSKAALDHATAILAAEQPELSVYAVDPGDLRTEMHQAAFPEEDISDRPLPETVVPAFRRIIDTRPASGRLRASELLVAMGGAA